jgi:preprotein translocase subunit SecF
MRRLFANAHYDFIGLRRYSYIGSGALLAICILAAVVWQFREHTFLNYGVDFTGGTLVHVNFVADDVTDDAVRSALAGDIPGATISSFGGSTEFVIRAPLMEETDAAGTGALVTNALAEHFGQNTFAIERTEAVSAKVGDELQARAILAVLLSFLATLIYLAIRFEWRFGMAAIIATFHDVMLTLGFIAALRLEVSLPTVAAVLTIVGYSLNDTIVIFDRIRENLASSRRADFIGILNRSINETLPRTVITAFTTLAVLFSLFLFGGAIIREFALIMIVGISLGTYSSIFVASPALLLIEQKWPGEQVRGVRKPRPATRTGGTGSTGAGGVKRSARV